MHTQNERYRRGTSRLDKLSDKALQTALATSGGGNGGSPTDERHHNALIDEYLRRAERPKRKRRRRRQSKTPAEASVDAKTSKRQKAKIAPSGINLRKQLRQIQDLIVERESAAEDIRDLLMAAGVIVRAIGRKVP